MDSSKKRRRFVLPLTLATAFAAAGGALYATGLLGGPASERVELVAEEGASNESPAGMLDAAVESWATEAAEASPPAPAAEPPVVNDPFLQLSAPPSYGAVEEEVTRGQSPGNPLRSAPADAGEASNPLRAAPASKGRYATTDASAAQQAFGEVLAADVETAAPSALPETAGAVTPTGYEGQDAAGQLTPPAPFAFDPPPSGASASGPPAPMPLESPAPIGAPAPLQSPEPLTPPAGLPPFDEVPPPGPPAFADSPTEAPAPQAFQPTVEQDEVHSVVTPGNQLRSASRDASPGYAAPPAAETGLIPAPAPAGLALTNPSAAPVAAALASDRPGERAMEGRQQPSLAIQKFAPAEVQIGKPAKLVTKVRNVGSRPAMAVVVSDRVPAGARLIATTPQARVVDGAVLWQLETIAPGEERAVEMEIAPMEEGELGSVATVSFAAHATARTLCTRPELQLRLSAPSQVMVGRMQTVKIELHNPGSGDATGVVLLENVPENLRHAAGPALEFEVGTLRAGETRAMDLSLQAEQAGRVINTLTARGDGGLQTQQSVEFDVVAPDLEVAVDGPSRRYLERPATYTVSIDNPGTAAARDVRIRTQLPRGMKFVKANNLGEYDAATHSVYWSLAELPGGERGHGEVQLTALPITPGDQTLQVEAQASEGLKDAASLPIRVEGIAALQFEVLDVEDPIEVGGQTTYEVRVTNKGSKAAANVRVTVTCPAGLRATAATGHTRHQVQGPSVVFDPLQQLPPQAEVLYRVRVEGVQAGDHRLMVEVMSDDLTQPVRKEESTRVFGDE